MTDVPDMARARWHISTYSGSGETCVEVAGNLPGVVCIRDSKDRAASPVLAVTPKAWRDFVTGLRAGEFGL